METARRLIDTPSPTLDAEAVSKVLEAIVLKVARRNGMQARIKCSMQGDVFQVDEKDPFVSVLELVRVARAYALTAAAFCKSKGET